MITVVLHTQCPESIWTEQMDPILPSMHQHWGGGAYRVWMTSIMVVFSRFSLLLFHDSHPETHSRSFSLLQSPELTVGKLSRRNKKKSLTLLNFFWKNIRSDFECVCEVTHSFFGVFLETCPSSCFCLRQHPLWQFIIKRGQSQKHFLFESQKKL